MSSENNKHPGNHGGLSCPACGSPISSRDVNPLNDMAYCRKCKFGFSYRELMANHASSRQDEPAPQLASNAEFIHETSPDGTERITRKKARILAPAIAMLAGCSIVAFLALRGTIPWNFALYSIPIGVCTIVVACRKFTSITLDSSRRILFSVNGFSRKELAYDDIADIDVVQLTPSTSRPYMIQAVMKDGKDRELFDGLSENDVDYLCHLLENRIFRQ